MVWTCYSKVMFGSNPQPTPPQDQEAAREQQILQELSKLRQEVLRLNQDVERNHQQLRELEQLVRQILGKIR